jgi:hypothetical protein
MPLIRRVLVRMIGFINSWLHTHSLIMLTHWQYSTISHLYNLHSLLQSSSTANFPWLSPAENLSGTAVCRCIPILLTNWNSLHTRYITSETDHTQKTSHATAIVETCVLSHCIATVAALTIANFITQQRAANIRSCTAVSLSRFLWLQQLLHGANMPQYLPY